MPAVHTFAIYAAMAVAFNFLLQVTLLVAVVTMDAKREADSRSDILCCIKMDKDLPVEEENCMPGGVLYYINNNIYVPILFSYPIRVIVVSGLLFGHSHSDGPCFEAQMSRSGCRGGGPRGRQGNK